MSARKMLIEKNKPLRVWVNQPSTLQPHHNIHGRVGIAIMEKDETRIYFTDGEVFSQFINPSALEVYAGQ